MEQIREFESIMKETIGLLDAIIALENRKLDAIAVNDTARLESLMNEEQAFLMQFRGFDKRRETWQQKNNCADLTFRQIIQTLPMDEQANFTTIYQDMAEKSKEVKSVTACAKKYIELHLHSLNALISSMQKGQQGVPYTNTGETQTKAHSRRLQETRI